MMLVITSVIYSTPIGIWLIPIVVCGIFFLFDTRPFKLGIRHKDAIRKNGIIHFTKTDFAEEILQSGHLKQGSNTKKVYFFIKIIICRVVLLIHSKSVFVA